MFKILIMIAMAAVTSSCKVQAPEKTSVQQAGVLVQDAALYDGPSDPFTLKSAAISKNILTIEVAYGGGCGGDRFTLAWNGALMKSLPPKANFRLIFKDGDNCRSIVTKKLAFDISAVYNGECVILLRDYEGSLVYKK